MNVVGLSIYFVLERTKKMKDGLIRVVKKAEGLDILNSQLSQGGPVLSRE